MSICTQLQALRYILGRLRDPVDGRVFEARQNLSSDDAMLLATTAKQIFRLSARVVWLEAALEAAIAEQRSEKKLLDSNLSVSKVQNLHLSYSYEM